MSDEAKAFVVKDENFAVHVSSAEGLNARVRRTIASVFHHLSPQLVELYFHDVGVRSSQHIATGQTARKSRSSDESVKIRWSRLQPARPLLQVVRAAFGCQMRRSRDGAIANKSAG